MRRAVQRIARSLSFAALAASLLADPADAGVLTKVIEQNELSLVDGLTGVDHVVVGPNDRLVCVTALTDQSIACHARNATTGRLAYGDVERDGAGGVDGIETPGVPGFDANGRHLYVPGSGEDALAVFSVGETGALGFVEAQREGFAGVAGLDAPAVARVSPDGAFVYAAGTTAIAIFERDPVSGALDWIAQQVLPVGVAGTLSMEIAPDGATVYLGTESDTLLAYARSAATGLLTLVDSEDETSTGLSSLDVYSLAPSRDGRVVYAGRLSSVVVFARASNGTLSFAQSAGIPAGSGVRIALAPDGRGVWASGASVGGVFTWIQEFLPIDPGTGLLGATQSGIFQGKNMQNGRIAASRDGRHLYVSDAANDGQGGVPDGPPVIDVLSVEPLAFVEKQGDGVAGVDGLDRVRSAAVSPDGRHVYAAGFLDDAVAVFSRDTATGALTFVEAEVDGAAGVDGLDAAIDVTLSPDGKHVYVCGSVDDAVAVFSRDAATGALAFVEIEKDGVGSVAGLNDAYASVVSPDGKHLYVVSLLDDAVTTFSRNATTGALSFLEEDREGVAGVSGLDGAADVAISPDGLYVFVAGSIGDSVAVFTRNPTSGALAFVESKLDGPGSDALDGADGIAVSRDGDHVYVVANADDAISVFSIGAGGALTLVDVIADTDVLVDGLDGARGIALTADDRHVVVASEGTGGFSVFRRDPATGEIGFAQAESNSTLFVGGGLAGSFGVAASPDGRSVYVAGADDDALMVFAPEPGAGAAWVAAGGGLLALARRRRRSAIAPHAAAAIQPHQSPQRA